MEQIYDITIQYIIKQEDDAQIDLVLFHYKRESANPILCLKKWASVVWVSSPWLRQ